MSVIGSAATTIQRVSRLGELHDPRTEAVGVGEEQGGVEPVEVQPGSRRRVRVPAGVVVAL